MIAAVYAGIVYRVWELRWSVPIYENGSDARFISAMLKGIQDHGWYLNNPQLNAPFEQQFYDFPHGGEFLQIAALKVLLWVVPGYAQAMNVYYLAGFAVLAAVAFAVLRHLRFGVLVALVLALAYTFLPYHFWHNQSHLFRSTYFTGPLACLLLLWTLSWRSWYLLDPDGRIRGNLRGRRVAAAVAIAVLIAATETMTTAFTMALLGASAIVAAARWKEPGRLVAAAATIAVLAISFVVVSSPSLIYWAANSTNEVVGERSVAESELYSLKISRLVLPQQGHRLAPYGEWGEQAQEGTVLPRLGEQYLGVIGIAGFFGALIGLFGRGLRRRRGTPSSDRRTLVEHSSLLVVLALLLGTVAGFGVVLALFGFSQVRTWGRIVVILGFLSLAIAGVWLDRGVHWLRRRSRRPVPVLLALTALFAAVALLDGIPPAGREHARFEAGWVSDERFVQAIEDHMPDDAAIFQLPVVPFPESPPIVAMQDYDHLRGYLHDDGTLRWSYGGIKGRNDADWQLAVRDRVGPVGSLPALVGMGFTGLWFDTLAFADRGASLLPAIEAELRTEPLVSSDGRFRFYDMRPFAQRLERRGIDVRAEAESRFGVTPPGS